MPLSLVQKTVSDDPNRFKVVVAGRRRGKSWLSMHRDGQARNGFLTLKMFYVASNI